MAILRSYLSSFVQPRTTSDPAQANQPTPPLSPYRQQSLIASNPLGSDILSVVQNIKNDIVETLKRVVDVVGRYAAAYLPTEARRRVKGFILALPGRWVTQTFSFDKYQACIDSIFFQF